jgi:nucleoside-diphosphate-sugar epimerase
MLKLLLAGGAGYIGCVLAEHLIELGYQVDVIDLLWFGNHLSAKVNVSQGNLFEVTIDDLAKYDQVVFLGGISNDPMAEFGPATNFIYNAALPAFLAFMAKRARVKRFIYASSCSVYGYTVNKLYDEESPAICHFPYGISKLQGEHGVMNLQDEKFSVISLRQGTVCGHSPRMRFDLVVNTMFKTAMTEGRITVNNPSLWRPIYHIRDAASAFVRAVQANAAISGTYNVTTDNYTLGQLGDIVKQELERLTGSRIKMDIKNISDLRNYKVSIQKARTELGFQPTHAIEDIVRELHENLASYGDFNNANFYNIQVFKSLKLHELIR